MSPEIQKKEVLIVTGGLISADEKSLGEALKKWREQWAHSQQGWLDFKIKLTFAEWLAKSAWERKKLRFAPAEFRNAIEQYFEFEDFQSVPSLTEVVLSDLLHREKITYASLPLSEIFAQSERAESLLCETRCIFLSSTYLHDLSELEPVLKRLKRPHNRIVVGGALAGTIQEIWDGMPEIDILAIGYGEMLVPVLADWIRSGYETLKAPARGRQRQKKQTRFLYSGVPDSSSLDFLPTPDWSLVFQESNPSRKMIYYESVRGCPYRCNFCNYPYLFDDTRFRYKSAKKMVEDWSHYVQTLGVEYITCLDSLFTMPKRRLIEFCQQLIQRNIRVRWSCYARADDLADEEMVLLMKAAGADQVQIGIESGDPQLLENMNKNCTVEANAQALTNCRRHQLTTVVTLIVGFPGETRESLKRTFQFLKATPPDFYFFATFSTRVAGVPLLSPENKERFGLKVLDNLYTMATYWKHQTMSCDEVGTHVRRLDREMMSQRVALNSALFYQGISAFHPDQRERLLDFQQRVAQTHWLLDPLFDVLHYWATRRISRDLKKQFKPTLPLARSL